MSKTYAGLTVVQIENFLRDDKAIRELYHDVAIRVRVEFQKIHAPAGEARKSSGRGKTLCGSRGIRGENVSCIHCLRKIGVV